MPKAVRVIIQLMQLRAKRSIHRKQLSIICRRLFKLQRTKKILVVINRCIVKKRRIAAINGSVNGISLVVLLGMLTGCGAKNSTVTLTIWGDADNQAILEQSFTEINEAFEKEHPNIKVDYQN